MPELAPFRAVRYAGPSAAVEACLAPPYDVISPAQRQGYAARDPHNIVHLILPQETPGDPAAKYAQAGATYRRWRSEGVLRLEAAPAIYVLHQAFSWEGTAYLRRGILASLRLRPFSDGVVLPHEKTLSGPKADRLKLFRATRANLSPIFALVNDGGYLAQALEPRGPPELAVRGDDGTDNRLWPLRDVAQIAALVERLGPLKAYIADGHHRYETGLAYAQEIDAAGGSASGPHHAILAYLCGLSDPGLLVLPTHRLLHGLAGFDPAMLRQRLSEHFDLEPLGALALDAARARLAEAGQLGPAFVLQVGAARWLLSLKGSVALGALPELPANPDLQRLDVTLLHALIFQRILGLSPGSQERQENLRYVKEAQEAAAAAESGGAQAAFFLNPTRLEQIERVAAAGEVMPQKSTFFHPKLPSGLLIHPLEAAPAPG